MIFDESTCNLHVCSRAHNRHLIFCRGKLVAIRVNGVRVSGSNAAPQHYICAC
jgi:hypothetical protein